MIYQRKKKTANAIGSIDQQSKNHASVEYKLLMISPCDFQT